MKNIITGCLLLISTILAAQSVEGSWKLISQNDQTVTDKEIVRIYMDGYFAEGARTLPSYEFIYAQGGEFDLDSENFTLDFHTSDATRVGKTLESEVEFVDENTMIIETKEDEQKWERISSAENDITGNWVITGRQRNGEMNRMTPGDRRTIKILGGDRFQWVAFNSATGEFFGTGGGTYTAENGRYTENIEFFSRNNSRVGASLEFDYEVRDGEWHHSGKSSKGDPMYEIWSPYHQAYSKE